MSECAKMQPMAEVCKVRRTDKRWGPGRGARQDDTQDSGPWGPNPSQNVAEVPPRNSEFWVLPRAWQENALGRRVWLSLEIVLQPQVGFLHEPQTSQKAQDPTEVKVNTQHNMISTPGPGPEPHSRQIGASVYHSKATPHTRPPQRSLMW